MNNITIKPSFKGCVCVAIVVNIGIIWLGLGRINHIFLTVLCGLMFILAIIYCFGNAILIKDGMATVRTPASTTQIKNVEAVEIYGWSVVVTGTGNTKHTLHCVKNLAQIREYIEKHLR